MPDQARRVPAFPVATQDASAAADPVGDLVRPPRRRHRWPGIPSDAPGGSGGIYESPLLQYTRLVVVSELPVMRDTLLVRLLGAGSTLKQALAELQALPAEAPERRLALPVLLRCD